MRTDTTADWPCWSKEKMRYDIWMNSKWRLKIGCHTNFLPISLLKCWWLSSWTSAVACSTAWWEQGRTQLQVSAGTHHDQAFFIARLTCHSHLTDLPQSIILALEWRFNIPWISYGGGLRSVLCRKGWKACKAKKGRTASRQGVCLTSTPACRAADFFNSSSCKRQMRVTAILYVHSKGMGLC